MSDVVKIYCEGKAGSHDFDILEKTLDGLGVLIVPIGGKRGAKSAIQVHESGLVKSKFKLFFRDRDFDMPVPTSEQLQTDGSYVYFSYRTTIENYLVNFDYIKKYSIGKSWDSESLRESYIKAARKIVYFQAVRHTFGKLRVPTDFGTNIVDGGSGTLPDDLSQHNCRVAGFAKITESVGKAKNWSKENFDKVFDEFVGQFNEQFLTDEKFLIFFQGKDFMKSLSLELPGFSPKDYYKYAKSVFKYTNHRDLIELRELVKKC